MTEVRMKAKAAKEASFVMLEKTTEQKNEALLMMAAGLRKEKDFLIRENGKDLDNGRAAGLPASTIDRIMINESRIEDMAAALELLTKLGDPIGETLETIEKENGLHIRKVRVPLGVIGMIYEARPNVTVDAASLSLKTGNSVLLKGSSSAIHSNKALVAVIHRALEQTEIPAACVQLIEDTSREAVREMFTLNDYLDVLIPRGGKQLIDTVVKESTVPVLETGAGNCHLYIDEDAQEKMAVEVAINSKTQRPSVCNSIESLLIHRSWFMQHGKTLLQALHDKGVALVGDESSMQAASFVEAATEEDYATEYVDMKLSVKVIDDVKEAISHINTYGTKHSEAIITENQLNARLFQQMVDAAAVYHNASTRFTDGFEFGYGAEIGISTQKLHARGPMGLHALTSSKYLISGDGQTRH